MSMSRIGAALLVLVAASWGSVALSLAQSAEPQDTRPLSPAQAALFETPHLRNVSQPETLEYSFVRSGDSGFTDRVEIHVGAPHADGTKSVSFDFLTGARHLPYPTVDNFAGNPLLMMFLERDVRDMKEQLGLSATYFRNRIRQAFVDRAVVADASFMLDGRALPAREITVRPFADDQRLERSPSVQGKTYVFVLADGVPGTLAELRSELPADPALGAPAFRETLTFVGDKP